MPPQSVFFWPGNVRSFWLRLALLTVLAVCLASWLVLRGLTQEERAMKAALQGRADMLIWALEGSARFFGPTQQAPMLKLVHEVARQPGLAYIALVDAQGYIVMHNDAAMLGGRLYEPDILQSLAAGPVSQNRLTYSPIAGVRVFETWKLFTPSRLRAHAPRHENSGHVRRHPPPPQAFPDGTMIFVGLESSHLEESLEAYLWQNGGMAALLILAGLGGTLLFHYIQNYRSSRRMLEDTQTLAAQVIKSYPAALLVTDADGRVSLSNRLGQDLLGINGQEESLPRLTDFPLLDWRSLMAQLDAGPAVLEREICLQRPNGHPQPANLSAARLVSSEGVGLGYLFVLRDMGEIRRLQKQLRQSERMSAFGHLAAGVAHEIRNPLSSIRGYATWLTEKLRHDKMAYATGQLLIQETERLNRVMSDLLGMARPHALRPAPVRLDILLERAVQLVSPEARAKNVALGLRLPAAQEAPMAFLDEDRILQTLLNLLVNAIQATEAGGHVEVSLEDSQAGPNGEPCWNIGISDTGCGMDPATVAQIFTPYFTTKATGSGLGLAIAQQIVAQHDGEISVYSHEGKGSTFTVALPKASDISVQACGNNKDTA